MFILIYGKNKCSYCNNAKKLAKSLKNKIDDFKYDYIDIEKLGMSIKELSKKLKKEISTVPQIIIDNKYIGGYEEFKKYLKIR